MQLKSFTIKTSLAGLLLLQACSSQVYNNKNFLKQTNIEGKKVAILPVEVELTGKLPKGMSESKKRQVEEEESRIIQSQLLGQYLYKSKKNSKKRKAVELINTDVVNAALKDRGIGLREAWRMNPDSLGRLLGADMVLKVRVKKDRIMSESASFGIGVATSVIGSILTKGDSNTMPAGGPRTYNLFLDATLSDVATHAVITKFAHKGDASWSTPPEKVIESSGRKIVRKGAVYARK